MAGESYGSNVTGKVVGKKLTLEIDLSKDLGPSKSGKTHLVATTRGPKQVEGYSKARIDIALNVFKYVKK